MNATLPVQKTCWCLPLGLSILLQQISVPTSASTQPSENSNDRPDRWITSVVQFPPEIPASATPSNLFANLRAEVGVEKLKILWSPDQPLSPASSITVHVSADELGHWPARDWRPFSMSLRGNTWEALVPVDDVDVPLVYFVMVTTGAAEGSNQVVSASSTNISPMRLCTPRLAGLEEPTRIFWPFLEGFEQDTISWRWLAPVERSVPLKTDPTSMTGRAALAISLPSGKRSVTIATTRVRGWQLVQQAATGLRVCLRTRQGTGRARFTLLCDASTTNQVVSVWRKEPVMTETWQEVDVLFSDLPKLPLGRVDLFAIEFIGQGPLEFLVDDLQLLGPWRVDLE